MNEAVYRTRSKSDTIFNRPAENNAAPYKYVLFSHFFTNVVSTSITSFQPVFLVLNIAFPSSIP